MMLLLMLLLLLVGMMMVVGVGIGNREGLKTRDCVIGHVSTRLGVAALHLLRCNLHALHAGLKVGVRHALMHVSRHEC